ncbi:HU family DNA-binding protein [Persephonella sp.]
MKRKQLVSAIAIWSGTTKATSKRVLEALERVILSDLPDGESITLNGVGTLSVEEKDGKRQVVFKPAKKLRDELKRR